MKIGISAWGAFGIGIAISAVLAALEAIRVLLIEVLGIEAPGLVATAVVVVVGLHMGGFIDVRRLLHL